MSCAELREPAPARCACACSLCRPDLHPHWTATGARVLYGLSSNRPKCRRARLVRRGTHTRGAS